MRTGRSGYACARANCGAACTAIAAGCEAEKSPARKPHGCLAARSGGPLLALDLGAMHDPAADSGRKRRAGAWCSDCPTGRDRRRARRAPRRIPADRRSSTARRAAPRIRELEPDQIGVAAAAEIEHAPAGVRMRAHQRMHGARRGERIVGRRDALAHIAAAVVGAVVLDLEAGDAALAVAAAAPRRCAYMLQNDVLPPLGGTSSA